MLWGRCRTTHGAPTYWPWIQAIRYYVRKHNPEEVRQQMEAVASDIVQILLEVREHLLGLEPSAVLDPEQVRFRIQTIQDPATNLGRAFDYYAQSGDLERAVAVAEHPVQAALGVVIGEQEVI